MSGGVLAPVWIVGAGVVGVGIAIGATIAAAGKIAAMGSVAAYEQIQIAKECAAAVKDAKNARAQAINAYHHSSCEAYRRINEATGAEILKLKKELEKKGMRIDLSELGHNDDEILLRLMALSISGAGAQKVHTLRTPAEIIKSVCALIDPLFIFIPSSDPVFTELTQIKRSAIELASSSAVPIAERTRRLLQTESDLLVNLERFKLLSRDYEYALAQFTALSYANKKLSEACGETAIERRYSAKNAKKLIQDLQTANKELSRKLREKMKSDQAFTAANRRLASLVEKAVSDSGLRLISSRDKDFGHVCVYEYESSLLRVIVSKDGMLSLDLVGKKGESKEQIKADEQAFCSKGLTAIFRSFERSGLMAQAESIKNLTDDSFLFEDELDLWETRRDTRDETEPQHMYVDSTGGDCV